MKKILILLLISLCPWLPTVAEADFSQKDYHKEGNEGLRDLVDSQGNKYSVDGDGRIDHFGSSRAGPGKDGGEFCREDSAAG